MGIELDDSGASDAGESRKIEIDQRISDLLAEDDAKVRRVYWLNREYLGGEGLPSGEPALRDQIRIELGQRLAGAGGA